MYFVYKYRAGRKNWQSQHYLGFKDLYQGENFSLEARKRIYVCLSVHFTNEEKIFSSGQTNSITVLK